MALSAPISVLHDPLKRASFVQTYRACSSSNFSSGVSNSLQCWRNTRLLMKASTEPTMITTNKDHTNYKPRIMIEAEDGRNLFDDVKDRFLNFKEKQVLGKSRTLSDSGSGTNPKDNFVFCTHQLACALACGEIFSLPTIPRTVHDHFKFLIVIGHSCCGGIRALMSMQDDVDSSGGFITSWVVVGKDARMKTKAAAFNLSFDRQCRHCEKESINHSLSNLLTYPWIREKVERGELSIHGGYYDFIDCTFQ